MRSCDSRESFRTRRPNRMIGSTTSGTPKRHSAASFGLVTIIMMMAPMPITMLRNAKDADEPTTTWISVVSAVSRDSTSPVRVVSKKFGLKDEHVVEDAGAHIGGDALADPGHEVEADRGGAAQDAGNGDQREEILADAARVLGGEPVIDDAAHGDGHDAASPPPRRRARGPRPRSCRDRA